MELYKYKNIIAIIIIFLVICVLYYYTKKQTDYFYSDITSEMEVAIEDDLVNCFNITVDDRFKLVNYLNSEFVTKNEIELLKKIKDITVPALIIMVRFIRLYSLDFVCKNETTNARIVRLSDLFFKQIKSLIKYHHAIFRVGNYNIGDLNFSDDVLFKDIVCLTKNKLLLDDQSILSDYDSIEYPDSISSQLLNTYPLYIYTQEIYNLIIKYAKKETTNYCSGVDLKTPKSLIPVYRMYPEGNVKQCNEQKYPKPMPTTSSSTSPTPIPQDRLNMKDTIFSTFDTVKAPIYSTTSKMYMTSLTSTSTSTSSLASIMSSVSQTQTPTQTPSSSRADSVSALYSGISGLFSVGNEPDYLSSFDAIDTNRMPIIPAQQTQTRSLNSNYVDPMTRTNILEAGSGPSYLGTNNINRTSGNNNSTAPVLYSPFYIPTTRTNQTVFPFNTDNDTNTNTNTSRPTSRPTNRPSSSSSSSSSSQVEGGSHNFKSYVEFPSYKNINLENDTGNNNFFLPNIFIS